MTPLTPIPIRGGVVELTVNGKTYSEEDTPQPWGLGNNWSVEIYSYEDEVIWEMDWNNVHYSYAVKDGYCAYKEGSSEYQLLHKITSLPFVWSFPSSTQQAVFTYVNPNLNKFDISNNKKQGGLVWRIHLKIYQLFS